MPFERLVEVEFIALAASQTSMIFSQLSEHFAITLGIQDAFDHDVETVVEREPRRQIDVRHAQRTRMVANMEDRSPKHVMADDRRAVAQLGSPAPNATSRCPSSRG